MTAPGPASARAASVSVLYIDDDPGISRLHAVLIAAPDGNWAVLDPGSANGTLVNGTEITIGEEVPLQDGDRINLGAWSTCVAGPDGRRPTAWADCGGRGAARPAARTGAQPGRP